MKKILLLLFLSSMAFGFGSSTVKKIDEIENNTAADITINPTSDVIITSGIANRVPYFDASKKLKSSSVTDVELGFLSGVTSGLQSQIDGKEPTISLAIDRAVISNGSGALSVATTTAAELDFVNGVTSSIQTQINAKLTSPLTTNGDLYYYNLGDQRLPIGTLDQLLTVDASGIALWKDAPVSTTLSVKGDIQAFDTGNAALNVGADGQLLSANSAIGIGLEWIDPPAVTPTTTEGDLILRGVSEDERLAIGTNLQLLTSNGTTANWQDAPVSTTLTTKGDLQGYDTANARVPVGLDNEVLFSDSTEATGVKWADPTTMVFSVAQAEFIFDVNIGGSGLINVASSSSIYKEITSTVMDLVINKGSDIEIPCSGVNPSTGLTCSVGSESLGVAFEAQVGIYEVCAEYGTFNSPSTLDAFAAFQLVETENNSQVILQEGGGRVSSGGNTPAANDTKYSAVSVCGTFDFSNAGKKTIRLMYERPFSTNFYLLTDRSIPNGQRDIHITGKYFPPKETIVRQNQIADALNTNGFDIKLNGVGSCTITNDPLGILSSCVRNSAGNYTINYSITLTDVPSLQVTAQKSGGIPWVTSAESSTTSSYTFTTRRSTTETAGDSPIIDVHIGKGLADYNKSLMVYGQFEQIKTTPLVKFSAYRSAAFTIAHNIASNVLPDTVVEDSSQAWDAVNSKYIVPKTSWYRVCGSVGGTPSANALVQTRIEYFGGGNIARATAYTDSGRTNTPNVCKPVKLNLGDEIILGFYQNSGLLMPGNTGVDLTYLTITEVADLASIVKNLNDDNNVKCQTKINTTNYIGSNSVDIVDLTFNNLTIGKRYSIAGQIWATTRGGVDTTVYFRSGASNTGEIYGVTWHRTVSTPAGITTHHPNVTFTSASTSLYFNVDAQSVSDGVNGDGTKERTFIELCELPSNYIETTEFN